MVVTPSNSGPERPVVLTIAGFDPSSGAGVTADLKVFAAHRLYGASAITALTVQSTQGVRRVEAVSPDLLRETLDCLAGDLTLAGIKVGMLGTGEVAEVVAEFLEKSGVPADRVVVDPVLRSSSGWELLTEEGVRRLKADLLPKAGWVTPNSEELAALAEMPVPSREAVPEAAARLAERYPGLNVVATGGHLDPPDDFLRMTGGETRWYSGERIETRATHGTGCAFSSALLSRLVLGDEPAEAVAIAKAYVVGAMRAAQPIGKGRGPVL